MTAVADRVATLLADPAAARAAGEEGRAWVEREWRWDGLGRPARPAAAGVSGGPEFLRTQADLAHVRAARPCFGYFLYGFGPSVPLLRDDLGVSSAVGGLHGTALAAGSTLAGVTLALLSRRVGRTGTLRVGLLGLAAGTLLYCLVPVLPVTLAGALVCGFFGS